MQIAVFIEYLHQALNEAGWNFHFNRKYCHTLNKIFGHQFTFKNNNTTIFHRVMYKLDQYYHL